MKNALATTLLGIAAAAAVITAPAAQADPDPAGYIAVLDSKGVQYPSTGKAIDLGMAVCSDLRQGAGLVSEGQDIVTASKGAVTPHDAGFIIGAAAATLCPDQNDRVQAEVAAYNH
jgi:hypothetical protein